MAHGIVCRAAARRGRAEPWRPPDRRHAEPPGPATPTAKGDPMLLRSGALAAVAALAVAAPAAGAVVTRHAVTASYKLTLEVGPTETMYTLAQEKTKHPRSGEVMLGNASMMGGMS